MGANVLKWDHFEILANGRSDIHCRIKESLLIKDLRRNPADVGVTSGQKPRTKTIYIVLQTSVGLF